MSNTYNPITFADLPTTDALLSSDQIIVFQNVDGKLSPNVYSLSDLSSSIVLRGEIADIENKVEAIKSQINDAMLYLQKTYISKATAAATYSTKNQLNSILSTLEKKTSFNDKLKDKATIEYLDYLYNKMLAICKEAKVRLGDATWDEGETGQGYKIILAKKAKTKEE